MRRYTWRLAAVSAAALLAVGLLPVTLVAVGAVAVASRRGWQPGRLYRAAAWCLPMLAVWLAGVVIERIPAPTEFWHTVYRGDLSAAAVLVLPVAAPAGLLAAGWAWSLRLRSMAAGPAGGPPLPRSASTSGSGATRCAARRPGSRRRAPSRC